VTQPRKLMVAGEPPRLPGVYALVLVKEGRNTAYVGTCADIRHRRAIWEHAFRKCAASSSALMPVDNFPTDVPAEEWRFMFWPHGESRVQEQDVRALLQEKGFTLIEKKRNAKQVFTYLGKTGSLAELAALYGVPYHRAHYRWKAGKTIEEILSLDRVKRVTPKPSATEPTAEPGSEDAQPDQTGNG